MNWGRIMNQIIFGMLAHVDAGKTTLTESLLFSAGAIDEIGRVDHGTAFLDTNPLEKTRGITIYSKEARFTMKEENLEVTLLDTPGHVDFSPEMERCLSVLDYAILVISGSDGVQSHTETVWRLLRSHKIPTFLFINKMDLPDLEESELMEELSSRLDSRCVNFSQNDSDDFLEQVALCDESLLSCFEKGTLDGDAICRGILENSVFPCFFGSALKLEGIDAFLQGITQYTCSTAQDRKKFGGKVFRITRDDSGNRLTHIKVTSGNLGVKDSLDINGVSEKINQIRLYSGGKYEIVRSVATGTVCAIVGLNESQGGMSLGIEQNVIPTTLAPVLTYTLEILDDIEPNFALTQLKQLQEEDPALVIQWMEEGQCIQVQIMGDVQLEVLSSVILERFGFGVAFGERSIIYRETLAENQLLEGVGHFEPLRHYAEVVLHLSPLPVDSGLVFEVDCPTHILPEQYQNLVLTHLKEKIHRGILTGSPLTDLKITLKGGRAHQKHTTGGDFREATYRALRQGLLQGVSVLLEPWCKVWLKLPNQNSGRGLSDIQRMGGTCEITQILEEFSILEGSAPLSQLGNYGNSVISYSGGRGSCQIGFLGYRACGNAAAVIADMAYIPSADECGDSIFCKNGAGFSVSWENVHKHMHCGSFLPKSVEEDTVSVVRQRVSRYGDSLAEDKDLMAIFERTYGKISSEKLHSVRSFQRNSPEVIIKVNKTKPVFLLVDGYNIIFGGEESSALARESLDSARVNLMNILCNYQGYYSCEICVVFDAYKVKNGVESVEKYHNITVVYTKESETADMYIEKATRRLFDDFLVKVATSDGLEQLIILGQGGFRMSARQFWLEIEKMNLELKQFLD